MSAPERIVSLSSDDDLQAWKREARALLKEGVHPDSVVWRVGGEGDLFASELGGTYAPPAEKVSIPRKAAKLVETALHHSGSGRLGLLYRFLWRAQRDRSLPDNMADPDTLAVHRLEKAVRRDAHKMHAFVRFRKVGEDDGRERYAAWFEPDHHIVEREAPFFVRRFANMDWAIVTPRKTAIYWGGEVFFAEGGRREDVPAEDAFEDAWRAYYASIFNPARIMTDAMRAEMPKKYWKNLPEAALIPELLEQAPARVAVMNARAAADDTARHTSRMLRVEPGHNSLESVHDAIRRFHAEELGDAVTKPVPGEGPPDANLFFIGEQPGDQEDITGRPFVGPAGQLFDRFLQAAGIDRSSAYVTNAVKRFNFIERGKRRIHQTPKAGEIDIWAPFLMQEHRLVQPKVTVTLGATALRGFFGRPVKLSEVRGETIPLPEELGGVCVPTFHPSYLLRIQDEGQRAIEERKFVADLEKARELAFA
ncbi:UdgX family uracil-DNA binding protein [Parvularcula lutaonensis]|uniref:Type-4 uracil-DNA glycosylase n=1 Tax=Parvularcula lutaonensis TaxID=491923 RepID=A0ABV7M7H9_9PROT|nr:UdgX family uracil-DNA binding protein [Parvularcula lutaonensis]GGY42297.1 uracil-DNA glycosylase [Parvularcula lutaonensis]